MVNQPWINLYCCIMLHPSQSETIPAPPARHKARSPAIRTLWRRRVCSKRRKRPWRCTKRPREKAVAPIDEPFMKYIDKSWYSSMVRWFSHIRWYIQSGNLPFLVGFSMFFTIFFQPETSIDTGICMDLPARWSPRAENWIVTSVRGTRYDGRYDWRINGPTQLAEVQWAGVSICQKDGTHDLYIILNIYVLILVLILYHWTILSDWSTARSPRPIRVESQML